MNQRTLDYVRDHRDRYTRDAIDAKLRESGHSEADITEAWATVSLESARASRVMSSYWRYWWLLVLGFGILATAVVALLSPTTEFYSPAAVATVLGVAVVIGILLSAGVVAMTAPRRRSFATAVTVGAVIPLLVILGLAGVCVASFPRVIY
jgi:cytochrome bd-type quinol oxidase subunit 2